MSSFFSSSNNSRKKNYDKADDASASREERMNRLKFELREHIRFLADYELLSTDWLRMAESLHQIANVAFMETHLPPSDENPLTQAGKKTHGTLWDQERDELAVRILLEEGKLNLALRILHKYRTAIRDSEKFTSNIKATSEKFNSDVITVTDRCRVFEQSVGILLKFAFSHVEALQIMDVPEFIQHCSEIMTEAEKSTKTNVSPLEIDKLQETLVLHYLSGLASAMEDMDEDRVMDLIQDHNLIPTLISHLHKHYHWYKLDALFDACKFLHGALSSEAYQAERGRFIVEKQTKQELCEFKALFLNEMISPAVGCKKTEIQMLLDEIAKYERTPGLTINKTAVPLKERLDKWKVEEAKEKAKAAAAAASSASTSSASSSSAPAAAATPKK